MWRRVYTKSLSCVRGQGVRQLSTTTTVINPKEYLKSWLGSDLGTNAPALHARRNRTNEKERISVPHSPMTSEDCSLPFSLKRMSLMSINVPWTKSLSDLIAGITPCENDVKLTCFLSMKGCNYSSNEVVELIRAYEANGYEIIVTNASEDIHSVLKDSGISFVMSSDLTLLHPACSSHLQVTSTQINIPSSKGKELICESNIKCIENKLQVGTVRSGQQVYAEDCSLTVMGTVNEGAEILSDGDIYVFGKLRGRAVAGLGAANPEKCRLYVTQFEASLIGIKSFFVVPEDHIVEYQLIKGRDVCISLESCEGVSSNSTNGQNECRPAICSIDCGDEFKMVFRPFL